MRTNNISKLTALTIGASTLLFSGCASMPRPLKVLATPIAVVRDVGDLILSPIAYGTQEAGDYLDFDGKIAKIRAEQADLEEEIKNNQRKEEKIMANFEADSKAEYKRLFGGTDRDYELAKARYNSEMGLKKTPSYTPTYSSSDSYSSSYPSSYNSSKGANGAELICGISKLISGIVGGIDYIGFRSLCGGPKGKSPWKKSKAPWGDFLFPNTRELWSKKEKY